MAFPRPATHRYPTIASRRKLTDRKEPSGDIVDIRKLTLDERRELYDAVFVVALRLTRCPTMADDLTQEAFLRLDTTRPWDPRGRTSLEQHMFGILKSVLSHERASDAARKERERKTEIDRLALSDAGHSTEVLSLDRARREKEQSLATRRVAALRASLAAFDLDLRIVALMSEGVTKRAHLVERTRGSLDDVKTALARIRRNMEDILAAERGEDKEDEGVA